MSIFYNPTTHPDAPRRFCTDNKIITPDDVWYKMGVHKAYPDYTAMMSECTYSGSAYYWENNKLHEVYMRQPFEFKPVDATHHHDAGINWGTEYFLSEEEAEAFWHKLRGQRNSIEYNPTYDIYSVHYHY